MSIWDDRKQTGTRYIRAFATSASFSFFLNEIEVKFVSNVKGHTSTYQISARKPISQLFSKTGPGLKPVTSRSRSVQSNNYTVQLAMTCTDTCDLFYSFPTSKRICSRQLLKTLRQKLTFCSQWLISPFVGIFSIIVNHFTFIYKDFQYFTKMFSKPSAANVLYVGKG